jgi:malate dehydrogenase (quinone)
LHADRDAAARGRTRFGIATLVPGLPRTVDDAAGTDTERAGTGSGLASLLRTRITAVGLRADLLQNLRYRIPRLGDSLFARAARRIIPALKPDELLPDRADGGLRTLLIDRRSGTPIAGRVSLSDGHGLRFNINPSTGATDCFAAAEHDLEQVAGRLGVPVDWAAFERDLLRRRDFDMDDDADARVAEAVVLKRA